MSVSLDTSVQLAWAIANTEANLAGDSCIRPVHFLLGILKLMDPAFASQLDGVELSEEQLSHLSSLPSRGRQYLEMKAPDITKLRRGIRKELRRGNKAHTDIRQLHRSRESRQIFSRLAGIALQERHPCIDAMQLMQVIVAAGAVDIEKAWQHVAKRPPSDEAKRKWSTGARWEILGDADPQAEAPCGSVLTDLTRLAKKGELIPVVGRDTEELSVCRLLNRTTKRNVLLVGEFGSGRRAIVEGLAQMACTPKARKEVAQLCFYAFDLQRLLTDVMARGGVAPVPEILAHIVARQSAVFVENPDFSEMLPPKCPQAMRDLMETLLSDRVGLIVSTTSRGRRHLEERYPSEANAFHVIEVVEPSPGDMNKIIDLWAARIGEAQAVQFSASARKAVSVHAPSLPAGVLPEKAIDLLDNVAAYARVRSLSSSDRTPRQKRLPVPDDQHLCSRGPNWRFRALERHQAR